MRVNLKGVAKVRAKGRTYYYAWRGGPRLKGEPGSPEFIKSYNEAIENLRTPDQSRFRALVTLYRASPDYKSLATSTQRTWSIWLDRIADHFGDLRIAQFDRPEKIRPIVRQWRNRWADKPRTADYAMQVLSRVLSYAVDPLGKLAGNPCEGIKRLYSGDRSEIIWTDADLAEFKAAASVQAALAADLAAHTGLRLGDLIRLSWSHIEDDAIVLRTGKSRHRREVIVPLYDELRALLARIPRVATTVLANSQRKSWTADGLKTAIQRAKVAARWEGKDLHFHDLRGTAATRFYIAGLKVRVVAEIMGWEEEAVEKIIRRYVGRSAATRAVIAQLNQAKNGT
jgi:integrase